MPCTVWALPPISTTHLSVACCAKAGISKESSSAKVQRFSSPIPSWMDSLLDDAVHVKTSHLLRLQVPLARVS